MDRREGAAKFALITDDRGTLNLDLLLYSGLSESDQRAVEKIVSDRAAGITAPAPAPAAASPAAAKPAALAAAAPTPPAAAPTAAPPPPKRDLPAPPGAPPAAPNA
jgi:hypothetical protein